MSAEPKAAEEGPEPRCPQCGGKSPCDGFECRQCYEQNVREHYRVVYRDHPELLARALDSLQKRN